MSRKAKRKTVKKSMDTAAKVSGAGLLEKPDADAKVIKNRRRRLVGRKKRKLYTKVLLSIASTIVILSALEVTFRGFKVSAKRENTGYVNIANSLEFRPHPYPSGNNRLYKYKPNSVWATEISYQIIMLYNQHMIKSTAYSRVRTLSLSILRIFSGAVVLVFRTSRFMSSTDTRMTALIG